MKNVQKAVSKALKVMANTENITRLMERYFTDFHKPVTKPKGKKNYIGIEIECYSFLEEGEVMALILAHDLEKYIDVGEDGSIESPNGELEYEIRALVPESQLSPFMKKLGKFLKAGKFRANYSCGLHIHLDMRNRDMLTCYHKLVKFQDILFGLVSRDRWDSEYCQYNTVVNENSRFVAINKQSYARHETIEVRLHQGCVDVKKIENWIKLLLKAIAYKPIHSRPASKAEVLEVLKRDKKISSYVKKNFKESWFRDRGDVINGEYDSQDVG